MRRTTMMPGDAARTPLASRGAIRLLAAAIATSMLAGHSFAATNPLERGVLGRTLDLDARVPVMQPVNAPTTIARVATVPGSRIGEAWAIGFTHARSPGYDLITDDGQAVFLRYTEQTGWRVWGPPLRHDGRPTNELLSDLALTGTGEGWAVGAQGALYHRAPGGDWILRPERLTVNALYDVALGEDARGVYGYAVGANLSILRLSDQGWQIDQPASATPTPGGTVPTLASVDVVGRDVAYAISGSNSNALMVFRRSDGAWQRVLTGEPIFDQPPAPVSTASGATMNQFARGGAVAVADGVVWISGVMQPIDPTRPTGSTSTSDRTRPFVLRTDAAAQAFRSWCPPVHQISNAGVEATVAVCDETFPFSTGNLPALDAVDGHVFAGGLGLFRYDGRAWAREPNVAGFIVSAAFSGSRDGWLASPGDVFGGGGFAFSSTTVLGHWTDRPAQPAIRRWAHPDDRPLEAVEISPDDRARAIAVGQRGAIVHLVDGIWDTVASPTTESLHALAWPMPGRAWAVGSKGTILSWDGSRWTGEPSGTTKHLYDVAFDGTHGVAVGQDGTILRYGNGRWRPDSSPVTTTLSAVAFAGAAIVAAGEKGTILESAGEGWRVVGSLDDELKIGASGSLPNFLSMGATDDGSVLIGGQRAAMVERTPDGGYRVARMGALEGSVHALQIARATHGLTAVASVGTGATRTLGAQLTQASGWLYAGDRHGWRDITLAHAGGSMPDLDAPAIHDAVYGIALDDSGRSGWAVGGFPDGVATNEGHQRSASTASIWRLDLDGPPNPSPVESRAPLPAEPGLGFAFLGDSACGSAFCSAVLGAGARADSILLEALRQIDAASADGLVRFTAFGGDMRRNGLPDELEPVARLLKQMRAPVYGVLGDKDLFAGATPAIGDQQSVDSTNGYALKTFADMPAPWGHAPPPDGIESARIAGEVAARTDRARTHYAFDVGGVRFVFLDTSKLPLALSAGDQNPAEEQTAWLQATLTDATTRGIPSVVFMHQPAVVPVTAGQDAVSLTSILTAGGASGVIASHHRVNERFLSPEHAAPDPVTVGVFGGAGSQLQARSQPARGGYHSWQLISIDPDPALRSLTNRAPITIHSIPILESMAIHGARGRSTGAGGTLVFEGLGRLPDVGGPHASGRNADPDQGNATYLAFPFPRVCGLLEDPARTTCRPASVEEPHYRFSSADPAVATFVRADPSDPTKPFRDEDGRLVRDERSGLLCTFDQGETEISVASGTVAARAPITVTEGSGPCAPAVFSPAVPSAPAATSAERPRAIPEEDPQPPTQRRHRLPEPAAVGAIAPPIVNAAPAPPSAGGGQRQDEHEPAGERADFSAPGRARRPAPHPVGGGVTAFLVTSLAFTAAAVTRPRRRYHLARNEHPLHYHQEER